ncbi:diguanylate cyclase [Absiella sp. AM29-15]|nr:diguanylate cyclase [Absiella sp. AM29-15]
MGWLDMNKRRSFITISISALMAVSILVLCLLTFQTNHKVFFDAAVNQTLETIHVIRDLGVEKVESQIKNLKMDVEGQIKEHHDILLHGSQMEQADALSNMLLPEDGIDYVLANSDGTMLDAKGNIINWKNELDLTEAFKNKNTSVIEPDFTSDQQYVFAIASPLLENGKIKSLLVMRLDGFCISHWLESIQFDTGEGTAYIVRKDGRNIASAREENYDWITTKYNAQEIKNQDEESKTVADLEAQALNGKTGYGSYLWEGSRNYLTYAPIKETGWGLYVGFYGELMNNFIEQSAGRSMISSAPFFIILAAFLILLYSYTNYNLKKEKQYANELLLQKKEIQQQAEDIKMNEERFRVALAQTNNILFEYDLQTGGITKFYTTKIKQITSSLNDLKEQIFMNGELDDESLEKLQKMLLETRKGIYDNECTIKVMYSNGKFAWYKVSISPLSEQRKRVIGIMKDITKEKLGELDPLTGLLNKRVMNEKTAAYLQKIQEQETCALLIFDIDDFKNINDQFGHPEGDKVIMKTGNYLKQVFKDNAYVGRIGGDEYCVFCFNISKEALEGKLRCFYQEAFRNEKKYITFSCGVVFGHHLRNITFEELYKQSDQALYKAKHQGKNQYCIQEIASLKQ